VSPAFDGFLLFALLNGMILGHDADRRHPCPSDHAALAGVVSRLLPTRQLGCGSPVTCWRRLRDWQRAGVWQRLHQLLLDERDRNCQLDRWPALPPRRRSDSGRTTSSRAVREAVTSA
jgi:transposase